MLPLERGAFEATRDHWWWRDGWGPGIRYLTWHLVFPDAPALDTAAVRFAATTADLPNVDAVPREWFHLTMTGVGFVGELPDEVVADVADGVLTASQTVEPAPLVFDHLHLYQDAIALRTDGPWLQQLNGLLQDHVVRAGGVAPDPDDTFHGHVTLAYFSGEIDETALTDALDRSDIEPVVVTRPTLALLELGRDDRVYTWRVLAERVLGD